MTDDERHAFESVLGHRFQHLELLERALTHRSRREGLHGPGAQDNESLEFLGDRVLGLAVSQWLCVSFPDWDSGQLSKALAQLVSTTSVSAAAVRLGMGNYLRLGKGEEKTGGREKRRLLADAYEAVLAAIYGDARLGGSRPVCRAQFDHPLDGNQNRNPTPRRPQIGTARVAPTAGNGIGGIRGEPREWTGPQKNV